MARIVDEAIIIGEFLKIFMSHFYQIFKEENMAMLMSQNYTIRKNENGKL